MVSRLDILKALADKANNPYAPGPLNNLPGPVKQVLGVLPVTSPFVGPGAELGRQIALHVLDNPVGKAAIGGTEALVGKAMTSPVIRGGEDEAAFRKRMQDQLFIQALTGYEQAQGNPYQRARAANEAGARGNEFEQGLYDAAADPVNFLTPLAKPLQGTKLARLGAVLEQVDQLQNMPIEGLAQVAKKGGGAAKAALIRRVLTMAEKGNVPGADLIPGIGKEGGKGIGPLLPPELGPELPPLHGPLEIPSIPGNVPYREAVPGIGREGKPGVGPPLPPELGPALPPLQGPALPEHGNVPGDWLIPGIGRGGRPGIGPTLLPEHGPEIPALYGPLDIPSIRGNVPVAEGIPGIGSGGKPGIGPVLSPEQGPALPAANAVRAGMLGNLSDDEVQTLANIAYSGPKAVENAATKYPDRAALASAALERITGKQPLAEALTTANEPLAQKLSDLPGRADAALPDATMQQLDQLIAEGTQGGRYGDFLTLIDSVTGDLPLPQSDFYTKKLGATPEEVAGYFQRARGEGLIGELPSDPGRFAVKPQRFGIGDIAAGGGGGGGGLGIIPYPGGINGPVARAVERGAIGGTAGLLGGAAVGATQDDENRLRGAANGALVGAGIGLGAGAGLANVNVPSYLKPLLVHSGQEFKRGLMEATERSTGSFVSAIKNIPATWRIGMTQHPRNIIGDEAWGRAVLGMSQGREALGTLRTLRNDMATRLKGATPWDREPIQIRDIQRVLNRENQLPVLGDSMAQAEHKMLTTTDTLIGGTLLSLLNPAAAATNLAGLGLSAGVGAARPGIRAWFEAFNGFQQATFRRAAYLDEAGQGLRIAAERFLPDLQAAGVNIASLSPDGMFSAADVRRVAGIPEADRWAALTDTVREAAENRVKFLFGDYSKRNFIEKMVGGAVPFTSWLIRAYPVGVAMLAQHPAVALGLYHYLNATRPDTEHGQPAYTAGMVPLNTDMPVIGAILQAYMPGADGTVYADPLGAISPFGGELVQPAQDTSGDNWYQKATGWLERLGLPGVNPALQAAAYATGLDYKAPSSTSRTKGLEEVLSLIPGNPQLPNLGPGLLATARRGLSPALEGVVPGVKGDKNAQPYDPITRRYSELVYDQTGKPLNDKANQAYLVAMADPDNPLLQEARREVLLGGATKNVASLTSPIGLVGQTAENKQYRSAAQGVPYSYDEIQRQKDAGFKLGNYMQQRVDTYKGSNPAANMYSVGNTEAAAYELLKQWEAANKDFLFVAPAAYNRQKRALMEKLGLIEPQKTGTK